MAMKLQQLRAETFHKRHGCVENAFRYAVDYMCVEFNCTGAPPYPSLFSHNAFNVAAFHDSDHGGVRGQGLGASWVHDVLQDQGLQTLLDAKVSLVAQPRVLGYVFNPISLWFIHDDEGLRAVIPEVNNTFGERHSYLCCHEDLRPIKPSDTLTARKVFHVSPFQPTEGTYEFRFRFDDRNIGALIDYRHDDGGVYATITGRRAAATNLSILKALLRRPFGSMRVISLIHFQAAILWFKSAKFWRQPAAPDQEVTRQ